MKPNMTGKQLKDSNILESKHINWFMKDLRVDNPIFKSLISTF